jgi:hypothetical protein
MNSIISIFGMIMSLFGMGTSTVGQVRSWQTQSPPAQVQTQQRCPQGSQPRIEQLADGSYRIDCVETAPQ